MNNVKRALARLDGEETKHYVLLAETTRGTLVMWRSVFQDTNLLFARFAGPEDEIDADTAVERTLDMDIVHNVERIALKGGTIEDEHFEAVQAILLAA